MKFNANKLWLIAGHAFFIWYFFLCWQMRESRFLLTDNAYYLFQIVNSKWFCIQHGRIASVITQTLPLIAVWCGATLKTVLSVYSVSFALCYYLAFLICVYKLKNLQSGIGICLMLTLGVYHSFYWPVSELQQGLIWCFICFAWLQQNSTPLTRRKQLVFCLLFSAASLFHPMMFFAVGFLLLIKWSELKYEKSFFTPALVIMGVLFIRTFVLTDDYEKSLRQPFQSLSYSLRHLFNLKSFDDFLHILKHDLIRIEIVALLLIALFIYKKQFSKFILTFLSVVGFCVLILVSLPSGESMFAFESYLLPATFFIIIAFITTGKNIFEKGLPVFGFLVLMIWSFNQITYINWYYKQRATLIKNICAVATNKNETYQLNSLSHIQDKMYFMWALPAETMIASSMNGNKQTVSVLYSDSLLTKTLNRVFIAQNQKPILISSLNKKYFNLKAGNYFPLPVEWSNDSLITLP